MKMRKRILSTVIAFIIGVIAINLTVIAEETDIVENSAAVMAIESIAEEYSKSDLISEGGNLYWILADMAVYEELYPDRNNILSEAQKKTALEAIVENADALSTPGDLSKAIIALRSLGYDAKNVYISETKKIDLVEKLIALVDEKAESVTNMYTVPYVIIALSQGEGYATAEQMKYLIDTVVADKASWQDVRYGTDGLTPIIAALAPYYNDNAEIKTAVDEAVEILKTEQREDGLIDGFAGYEAASTALAIWGLSNLGIDSTQIIKGEKSLIDGLTDEDFSNAFSKEQGFRGLLAWQLLCGGTGKILYDFSDYPMNEVNAPTHEPSQEPSLDTPADDDSYDGEDSQITIQIKVMVHDADECNNSYTYKNNSSKYTALVDESVVIEIGQTVFDVLEIALEKNGIDFVESSYGYISSIDSLGELDHGNNSGWMFTVGGKHQNQGSRDTRLVESTAVVWFYTDDYTKDNDSSGNSLSLSESKENHEKDNEEKNDEQEAIDGLQNKHEDINKTSIIHSEKTFTDILEHEDRIYIEALSQRGIINGKTDESYEPDINMTRAEFAAIVVRALGLWKNDGESFDDVDEGDWFYSYVACAYGYGIINGVSESKFAPDELITKEQAAVMTARAAKLCGMDTEMIDKAVINTLAGFTDYISAASWAKQSLAFCYSNGILSDEEIEIQPQKMVTRCEIAVMIYNLLQLSKLL